MKNIFLKYLTLFASSLIPKHKKNNRILLVSTTALGDTLWATPAIENIRNAHPKAYIACLTSSIGLQILKHNPHIDQFFHLKEPLSHHFFSLWKTLYKERFDTILIFHASQRLILPLCSLLGASQLIATAGINKGLDALLTHPLPNIEQHQITRRLKIGEAIGAPSHIQALSFHLQPNELLPPRPGLWIAIHPGAKDSYKRWPTESFIALGKLLKEKLSCEILITGTREERSLMEEVAAQIPGAHLDEPNRSLRSFAALLKQMNLLITNDTGPFHLASALHTPVIGIYSSTDPARCGPHQAPFSKVISRRPSCDPCLKRKCRLPFCFLRIGPEEVAASAIELLS
jgi:ADP-heptose:LPS heptosyltransferase